MALIFDNGFWQVERDLARALVVIRRTPRPYGELAEVSTAFEALERALDDAGRADFSVLVDMRDAPSRNDGAFERAASNQPRGVSRGYERGAVLVRTAAGKLNIQRVTQGLSVQVFDDEAEALLYVRGMAPRRS